MIELLETIEPPLCGFYRITPDAVGLLTVGEARIMLDGMDWVSDRDWELAVFQHLSGDAASTFLGYRYPRYHRPPVVSVTTRTRASPRRRG